jgi:hypothetical protein
MTDRLESYTIYSGVVRFYQIFVLPLLQLFLFGTVFVCFIELSQSSQKIRDVYGNLYLENHPLNLEELQSLCHIQLLVSGILSLAIALFQLTCISSSIRLNSNLKLSILELSKTALENGLITENNTRDIMIANSIHTTTIEKLIVVWCSLLGLYNIYVNGICFTIY